MLELGIKDSSYAQYSEYLENHRSEWKELESMTHITISRFFRDGPVWQYILSAVFPSLASLVGVEGPVRAWVMGFSSGEEVYSLKAAWSLGMSHYKEGPLPELHIVASEYDKTAVARAKAGKYDSNMLKVWQQSPSIWPFCADGSSFKEFPDAWAKKVFKDENGTATVRPVFKKDIIWRCEAWQAAKQPEWEEKCEPPFHLVLARNGPFTYPDTATQLDLLRLVEDYLVPGGVLVIGKQESLPGLQYASKKDTGELDGWERAKAEDWEGDALPVLHWPPPPPTKSGGKPKREAVTMDPRVGRPQGMVWRRT